MRITSGGLVLVGTADTGFSGTLTNMTVGNTSTTNTGITIASSSSDGFSRLHFADGNSGTATYAGWIAYDHADDELQFSAGNSGSAKVTLTSTGDVGINCTPHSNAGINLQIHGDNTTSEIRLTNTTTGSGNNGGTIQMGGNTLYISNSENGNTVFENNGSERIRIASDGKILVGGYSSSSVISAGGVESSNGSGNNFGAGRFVASAGGPDFWFIKSRNATVGSHTVVQSGDNTGTIQFAGSDGDSYTRTASILSEVDGTPGDADMPGRLIFQTTADGASSPTTRLKITSDGKLWTTRTHASSNTGNHPAVDIDTYSNDGSPRAAMATGIDFSVEGVHKKRLAVTYADSSAGTGDWIFYRDNGNNEGLRIPSDGKVTTTTNNNVVGLLVKNSTHDSKLQIYAEAANKNSTIWFGDAADDDIGKIDYDHNNNYMSFTTNTNERLCITSTGKVLIGDSSTTNGVSGTGLRIDSNNVGANYSEGAISLYGTGGDFYAMTMRDSNDNGWGILPIFSSSPDRLSFGYYGATGATNSTVFTMYSDGDAKVNDGDLVIGTAGHGIDFSAQTTSTATGASASNEVLDHYEKGTWTPTIASGGFTIDSNVYSKYVRIGDFLHVQFYIGLAGTGNSNNLSFGGLPYAVNTNGYAVGTVDFGLGGIKGAYMRTSSGGSTLSFFYPSENVSNNRENLRGNQVGASYVIATITYLID